MISELYLYALGVLNWQKKNHPDKKKSSETSNKYQDHSGSSSSEQIEMEYQTLLGALMAMPFTLRLSELKISEILCRNTRLKKSGKLGELQLWRLPGHPSNASYTGLGFPSKEARINLLSVSIPGVDMEVNLN